MTDRNDDLQDQFDRHFRGDGPPPSTDGDPEAAAYEVVFSVLEEEPEGDLPPDFAEQVADRVRVGSEPALAWSDVVLLFLLVAALGATIVLMPSSLTTVQETTALILRSVQSLSTYVRLDVVAAVGGVLALTVGLDRLLKEWVPLRHVPSPSS
ncbi:MAG: hypothetical protein ABEL97_04095 [Salinibacter sp.]